MFNNLFIGFSLVIALIHVHATFANTDFSQQLGECEKHLQANRLTTGVGGTAFECYQAVLKKDAKNAEALAGIEKIEARYVGWAKRALERGQKNKAEQFLVGLRKVNPDSSALAKLEAQLQPPSNKAPALSGEPKKSSSSEKESSKSNEPNSGTKKESSRSNDSDSGTEKENLKSNQIDSSTEKKNSKSNQTDSEKTSAPNDTKEEEASQPVEEPQPPKVVQIVDLGQIYELINTTDCLEWPTPKMKEKGGKNGWESFYPKKDESGLLIKEMQHCHFDNKVYLLQIEEYYVAISSTGTKMVEPSDEPEQQSP